MKVLYFHQHFSTPQGSTGTRSYEFARRLVARGHEVTVVCGSYALAETGVKGKPAGGVRRGKVEGIEVVEICLAYSNYDGFLKRSRTFLRFALKSIQIAWREPYDVLFATSTPLTAGIPGIAMRLLKPRCRFVFEVRDLWPELPRAMGVIKNPLVLAGLSFLEKACYLAMHAGVALSPGIEAGMRRRAGGAKPIAMIPNGCDVGLFASLDEEKGGETLRGEAGGDAALRCVFAGAHGRANGLHAVLDAARILQDRGRGDVQLVFIGDGKEKPGLERRAVREGLTNCKFLDPLPKLELFAALRSMDAGLMVLENVPAFYYGTSPNKFFDYLAAGLPVLNNYPGWLADMIREHRCGMAVRPGDAEAFADALGWLADHRDQLREMGGRARELAARDFDRERLADRWVDALERAARRDRAAERARWPDAKRIFDVLVGGAALLVVAPLLALIAVVIRATMGRPVLFAQRRPGWHGRPFTIYKFRTMSDARDGRGRLLPDGKRLTRLGRLLRSTSMDELPELFNVLRGDMSLVGPRPLLMEYLDRYTPEQARRHEVRPGITGWAQVNGRNAISWNERFRRDVWYIDHRSWWLDLRILWLTILWVARREGVSHGTHATMPKFSNDGRQTEDPHVTRGPVGVIGAGGQGKVVVRLLQELGYDVAAVYDDDPHRIGAEVFGVPVVGPSDRAREDELAGAVIAVGDNARRKALAERLDLPWLTLVHPRAFLDASARLGRGSVVLAGAAVQADAEIGSHTIVNTGASVDHDCRIGDYAHLAPGVRLSGDVVVGEGGLVGTGASAIPGAEIGAWSTVGAGAVVIGEVAPRAVAVGVPARVKRKPAPTASGRVARRVAEPVASADGAGNGHARRAAGEADGLPRIYLSPPHLSGAERELLWQALESNWIAPLGPQVDAFEREFAARVGVEHAVALSSGTAALHLALLALGVGKGDRVFLSTLTFVAPVNAVRYVGAEPVFIDSDAGSWNMDPQLLADALEEAARQNRLPKAVLVVDVFGQCADYELIRKVCEFYEVPVIEDAAEALGATFQGRSAGAFGEIGCYSFNGNKIITTSGGGMLVTGHEAWARRARHLATQAKEAAPHYEHSEVGYNYRLSNLLAAIGRGQLRVLDERVARRRAHFDFYRAQLGELPGIHFMPELAGGRASRWLTCLLVDPRESGVARQDLQSALAGRNIEARPVWKPMHLQPVYRDCAVYGGAVAEALFSQGLCLPSGSSLTSDELERVVAAIREAASKPAPAPLAVPATS